MDRIAVSFAEYFSNWSIGLPNENLESRQAGEIRKAGWDIRFIFGAEGGKEYLEFYATHRMTNDRHERICEDGSIESLDAQLDFVVYPSDADEATRRKIDEQQRERNRQIAKQLRERGLATSNVRQNTKQRCSMTEFGCLKHVDPRAIWKHEAIDFSPWLAENIACLGSVLGMDLELVEREADVGGFSLDLLAKDLGSQKTVIIENQLEGTDHDHLGKLLTYAAGFDASAVVWLSKEMREEHRLALEWLNHRTTDETQFFGVVLEVLQIDESKPAFNFKVEVSPNEWQRAKRRPKPTALSSRSEAYRDYFQQLLDELREKHHFTGARVGQPQNWYSFTSGCKYANYSTSFAQGGRVRVELYIDSGSEETNQTLFSFLDEKKTAIESAFGESLEWEPLESRRASRIAIYRDGSIDMPTESLEVIRQWVISRLLKFKEVFAPYLSQFQAGHQELSHQLT